VANYFIFRGENLDIQEGCIVISKNGRDKSKYFVVVKVEDNLIYLCDGAIRKFELPKKKKIKHVQLTNMFSEYINVAIKEKRVLTNKEVQKEIARIVSKEEVV